MQTTQSRGSRPTRSGLWLAGLFTVLLAGQASAQINLTASFSGPDEYTPGSSNISYQLVVTNSGDTDDTAPALSTGFPADANVTWNCAASGGSTCSAGSGSGNLNDSTSTIAAGGGELTFSFEVDFGSNLIADPLTVAANVIDSNSTPVTPALEVASDLHLVADLSTTKTAAAASYVPGTSVTGAYTIAVTNAGPSDADGVLLEDTAPADMVIGAWGCEDSGGTPCPNGSGSGDISETFTIPAGETFTWTLDASYPADALTDPLVNEAVLTVPDRLNDPDDNDPNAGDHSESDSSSQDRDARVDLSASFQSPASTYAPGTTATHHLMLANAGPSDARAADASIRLTLTDPDRIESLDLSCDPTANCTPSTAVLTDFGAAQNGDGSFTLSFDFSVDIASSDSVNVALEIDHDSRALSDELVLGATITAAADETDTDTDNNDSELPLDIDRRAGIRIEKTASVAQTSPNSEFTYTLIVHNDGPGDLGHDQGSNDGALVTDLLSTSLKGQASVCPENDGSQPCWKYCRSDNGASTPIDPDNCPSEVVTGQGSLENVPLSIAAGNSSTVVIYVATAGTASSSINNTASVALASPGPVTEEGPSGDNEDSATVEVIIGGDLSVSKDDGTTTAVPGEEHSYTLVVENHGLIGANKVRVTDHLPIFGAGTSAGFEPGSVSFQCQAFDGACCQHNSSQCGAGQPTLPLFADSLDEYVDLPGGSSVVYTISGTLDPKAEGTLSNTASITAPAGFEDPNPANDSSTDDDTELVPVAGLAITKKLVSLEPVNESDDGPPFQMTYQIDVSNAGPSHVDDGLIQDLLDDPGFENGTASWYCEVTDPSGGSECLDTSPAAPIRDVSSVTENVILGPGGSVRLMVEVATTDIAEGQINNQADVTSGAGSDSTAISSGLRGQADLWLNKTSNRSAIAPGTEIEYLITVGNDGPDNVFGAAVSDTFPPQITDVSWTCQATTPIPGDLSLQRTLGTAETAGRAAVSSADGRHIYLAAGSGALFVFDRDATPGLTFGRIALLETEVQGKNDSSDTGSAVSGMTAPIDVLLSPDGHHVYVLSAAAGENPAAIATFQRNNNRADQASFGRLTFVDQVTEGVPSTPRRMTMTDDHLYLSGDEQIAIFARDPATGLPAHNSDFSVDLPPAPGPMVIDPAGPYLFAGSSSGQGITAYTIATAGGAFPAGQLIPINTLNTSDSTGLVDLKLAPDAPQLYAVAAQSQRLVMIDYSDLDATGLRLDFSYTNTDLGGSGLLDASARIDITGDGEHLLLSNHSAGALTRLRRDPASGGLSLEESLSSADAGHAVLAYASNLLVTPDGRHVLVVLDGSPAGSLARYSRLAPDPLFAFIEQDRDGQAGLTGMRGVHDVAVSVDGDHVYALSFADDSIHVFNRDPRGGMTDDTLGAHLQHLASYSQGENGIDGLVEPRRILLSRDGRSVFVTSQVGNSLAVFQRNNDDASPNYGRLSFQAVHRDGNAGVNGLAGAQGMALDSSGRHLYVAGAFAAAIAVFDRDPTTLELTWRQHLLNGDDGVRGLNGIHDLALSPDGAQLLGVSTTDNSLVVFNRDNQAASETAGALTFLQRQQSGIGTQPMALAIPGASAEGSGEHVYVAGQNSNTIAVLRRVTDPSSSAFGQVQPLEILNNGDAGVAFLSSPRALEVSPDGKRVYVASEGSGSLLVLDRDLNATSPGFGRLTAVEVRRNQVDGVAGIGQVRALAVSNDSRNVYAAGFGSHALASFLRGTGSSCTAGGGGDIDDRVDIGVGGTLQYRARGTVAASASGQLVNTARISPPERFDDPDADDPGGNNEDDDRIDLIPEADLNLAKVAGSVSVTAGESTSYELTITNPGPSNLVHEPGMPLTLTDSPDPAQFDIASASWTCQASGSGALEFLSARLPADAGGAPGFDAMRGLTGAVYVDAAGNIPALAAVSVIDSALLVFPLDPISGELAPPIVTQNGDSLPGGIVASLSGASSIAASADGRFLYVASRIDDAVTVFELLDNGGDIEIDLLEQHDGATGLDQAVHLILGPGDAQLYVAGVNDNAVAVFTRHGDGSLTLLESLQNGQPSAGNMIAGLLDVEHLNISPNGEHLYALSGSSGQIAVFARDAADGSLIWQQRYGESELGSPMGGAGSAVFDTQGQYLYVAAAAADRIVVLQRESSGELSLASSFSQDETGISGLGGVRRLLLSGDGNHLYATSPVANSVIWLRRDPADGSLRYGGVRANSSALVDGLEGATSMALNPALDQLLITGTQQPAVSRFQRQNDSSCPASGSGAIEAVAFDIAAGGTVRFDMTIDVLAEVDSEVTNTASLNAARDSNQANNNATETSPISQSADLSITKDDGLREIDGLADAAALAGTADTLYVAGRGDAAIAVFNRNAASGDAQFGKLSFKTALRDGDAGLTGLSEVSDLALDSHAETLYAAARGDNTVVVFNRQADGGLEARQVLKNGVDGVSGISGANRLAVAPDNAHVYVTGAYSNSIAVMMRTDNPGGSDHGQLQLFQSLEDGVNNVQGIGSPAAFALSPDGRHAYVLGREEDSLALFSREANPGSANFGRLSYQTHYRNNRDDIVGLGGVRDMAISADGRFVYVLGDEDGTLAVFERDPSSGELVCLPNSESEQTACFFRQDGFGDTAGLRNARSLRLDGNNLYVAGNGSITRFSLDPSDGIPTFAEQIVNGDPAHLTGGEVFGLDDTAALWLPADGGQLYAASGGANAVITFQRNVAAEPSLAFADIQIDGLGGVAPGEEVFYTIVVHNHGPSAAPEALVVDEFPDQFENVSWTCTAAHGAQCAGSGEGDINTEVALPVGGRVTFTAGGRIKDDATGRLVNTASVSGGNILDPDPSNNQATDDDTVLAPASDLNISVTNGSNEVTPGLATSYEVKIRNLGPSYADDIGISDIVPAALYDVSWECTPQPRAGELASSIGSPAALDEHRDIVFSGNGRHAYVSGRIGSDDAVVVYQRNSISGALEFSQALRQDVDGVVSLQGVNGLALSPDGRFLYAAARSADAIARFERDAASGELSFQGFVQDGQAGIQALGGVSRLLFSPDGAWLHAISPDAAALSAFAINPSDGSLDQQWVLRNGDPLPDQALRLDGLNDATDLAWSAQGDHLLVSAGANRSLTAFSRNAFSGELAWAGMISSDGSDQLDGPAALVVTENDEIFVSSPTANRIDRFQFTVASDNGVEFDPLTPITAATLPGANMASAAALGYSADRARLYVQHQGGVTLISLMQTEPLLIANYRINDHALLQGLRSLTIGPGQRQLYTLGNQVAAWSRERGSRCQLEGHEQLDGQQAEITAGGNLTYMVNGKIQANAIGELRYRVEAMSALPERELNPADNQAVDSDTLLPRPDLSINKSAAPNPVVAGEAITFAIDSRNAGPSDAMLAQLADTPPIHPDAGGLLAGSGSWQCSANPPLEAAQAWPGSHVLSDLAVGNFGVYAVSATDDALIIYPRTANTLGTPAIIQNGDIHSGSTVAGLGGATALTVSPEEDHLYVVGHADDSLTVFTRSGPGAAFEMLEHHQSGVDGVIGLIAPVSVQLSADGRNVYVASDAADGRAKPAIAVFSREPGSGKLTFVERLADGISLGQQSDVLNGIRTTFTTRDEGHLYAVAHDSAALSHFQRSHEDGSLSLAAVWRHGDVDDGRTVAIEEPVDLTSGPADEQLYVLGKTGIARFNRTADGSLVFQQAWSDISGLGEPRAIEIDPAGTRLYLLDDQAIHVFARDWASGNIEHRDRIELAGASRLAGDSDSSLLWSFAGDTLLAFPELALSRCLQSQDIADNLAVELELGVGGYSAIDYGAVVHPSARGQVINIASIDSGTGIDDDTSDNISESVTDIEVVSDIAISKSGPAEAIAGERITYRFEVTNVGPSSALGIGIDDFTDPPAALLDPEWSCTVVDNGGIGDSTCPSTSDSAGFAADLMVGDVLIIEAEVTIDPAIIGELINTAELVPEPDATDPTPQDQSSSARTQVRAVADVAVSKRLQNDAVVAGEQIEWEIIVSNPGPSDAPQVAVSDLLDSRLRNKQWTCQGMNGATCPSASGSGDPVLALALPAGSQARLRVSGQLPSDATGELFNEATAQAAAPVEDPDHGNNSAATRHTVVARPDVAVAIATPLNPFDPDGPAPLPLTLTLHNNGPSDASETMVDLSFDAGVSATAQGCSGQPNGLSCRTLALPSGNSVSWHIQVSDLPPAGRSLVAEALAVTLDDDPDLANNVASQTIELRNGPDMNVAIDNGRHEVSPGELLTYTITFSNLGSRTADVVAVDVPISADLIDVNWTCLAAGSIGCDKAGTGDISDQLTLAPGEQVVYMLEARVDPNLNPGSGSSFLEQAAHAIPASPDELNDDNNSAMDRDLVRITLFQDRFEQH